MIFSSSVRKHSLFFGTDEMIQYYSEGGVSFVVQKL